GAVSDQKGEYIRPLDYGQGPHKLRAITVTKARCPGHRPGDTDDERLGRNTQLSADSLPRGNSFLLSPEERRPPGGGHCAACAERKRPTDEVRGPPDVPGGQTAKHPLVKSERRPQEPQSCADPGADRVSTADYVLLPKYRPRQDQSHPTGQSRPLHDYEV